MIMGFGTSSILLNGVSGKVKENPLSPILFVLASGLLQSIVNNAMHRGILLMPLAERCGLDFPIT
jgi:hypothetical protein